MQIFPNPESVIRLVGALLVEMNDEMIAADRRSIAEASVAALLEPDRDARSTPNLTTESHGTYTTTRDAIRRLGRLGTGSAIRGHSCVLKRL